MHNNNAPPLLKKPQARPFYSVVEAAVAWARAEGVRSANDPLISRNTMILLEAIKSGNLRASASDSGSDLSSIITSDALKNWMMKYHPEARPAFLFGAK